MIEKNDKNKNQNKKIIQQTQSFAKRFRNRVLIQRLQIRTN